MEVSIRKMGNSQGVLIPKPILAQVGLEGTADLQVRNGVIEIRAIRRNPRKGWADDARRLAEQATTRWSGPNSRTRRRRAVWYEGRRHLARTTRPDRR